MSFTTANLVEEQWATQLENANKAAKSALSALAVFTAVFILTAITNQTERAQANGRTARLAKLKGEVDGKIRGIYETWSTDYAPAQQAIDANNQLVFYIANHREAIGNDDLERARGYLSEFEGWYNALFVLRNPRTGVSKQFEELSHTQRGYLCSLIFMDQYMNSEGFGPLLKQVNSVISRQNSDNRTVYHQFLIPLLADEDQLENIALVHPLFIPQLPKDYQIDSPELFRRFAYNPKRQSSKNSPEDSDISPISDPEGYANLANELQDDVKSEVQLATASVTFPLINFTVNLTSIGIAGVIANVAIMGYLFVVLERLRAVTANLVRVKGRNVEAGVALLSDFPLIGKSDRRSSQIQSLSIVFPAIASISYYWFTVWKHQGFFDVFINPFTGIALILALALLMYFSRKLKADAQAIGSSLGVRDCVFSAKPCPREYCSSCSSYCSTHSSPTEAIQDPIA